MMGWPWKQCRNESTKIRSRRGPHLSLNHFPWNPFQQRRASGGCISTESKRKGVGVEIRQGTGGLLAGSFLTLQEALQILHDQK